MTTGSKVQNKLYPNPYIGGVFDGTRYSRTWTGSDWTVLPKPEKPPLLDPTFLTKKGRRKVAADILANNRYVIEQWKRNMASYRKRVVKRQRERRYEHHPYSCTIVSSEDSPLYAQYAYPPAAGQQPQWQDRVKADWSSYGSTSSSFIPWTAEDDYILAEKLKRKIIGSSFNLGIFAAESEMALKMIFNAARRLAGAMAAVKKGNLLRAARLLRPSGSATRRVAPFVSETRSMASHYLEWTYGWAPLISDLQAGAEMLAHMNSMPYQLTVRVNRRKGGSISSGSPSNAKDIGGCKSSKQLIAYLREVDVPQLIGLTNWQSVAWEVTPWSFVADWAIPIGNYLSARGIASALKGTFVTTYCTRTECTGRELLPIPGRLNRTLVSGPYSYRKTTVDRTISTSLKVPTPQVVPFGDVLSWRRAANAVALLIQQRVK